MSWDRVRGLIGGYERPVGKQFLLVQRGPLDDIAEEERRQPPGEHGERVDADGDRFPAVERVE
jgi:hypothetical protein